MYCCKHYGLSSIILKLELSFYILFMYVSVYAGVSSSGEAVKVAAEITGREAGLVGAMACVPVPAPLVDSRHGGSSHVDGAHPTSAAQVSCVSHHLNASP
jgi:hypothetical protein